MVTDKRLS